VAVDLGTATSQVHVRGRGVVVDEPSVAAVDRTGRVVAVGAAAEDAAEDPGLALVRPVTRGAVHDVDLATKLLRALLERAGVRRRPRPKVLVCAPPAATEVERRALARAARDAGGDPVLLESVTAAALGAGAPVTSPLGTMVLDVGGGATRAAVLSMGVVVASSVERVGGLDVDAAVRAWLKRAGGLAVGERTATAVTRALASIGEGTTDAVEVAGRDAGTGAAATAVVSSDEVAAAVDDTLAAITGAAVACLATTPPELARDLTHRPVHLVGGGALLRGVGPRLELATGLSAAVVEDPVTCAVRGAAHCFEAPAALRAATVRPVAHGRGTRPGSRRG
jgi:rod shape-determining protein MreB and related proteins